jgi:hypothetical protein
VHEIGRRLARSRDEIERATQLLDDHWIGTLADWSRLSPDHRKEVGLPLLLSSSLDELVSQRERGGSSSKPALSTGGSCIVPVPDQPRCVHNRRRWSLLSWVSALTIASVSSLHMSSPSRDRCHDEGRLLPGPGLVSMLRNRGPHVRVRALWYALPAPCSTTIACPTVRSRMLIASATCFI